MFGGPVNGGLYMYAIYATNMVFWSSIRRLFDIYPIGTLKSFSHIELISFPDFLSNYMIYKGLPTQLIPPEKFIGFLEELTTAILFLFIARSVNSL